MALSITQPAIKAAGTVEETHEGQKGRDFTRSAPIPSGLKAKTDIFISTSELERWIVGAFYMRAFYPYFDFCAILNNFEKLITYGFAVCMARALLSIHAQPVPLLSWQSNQSRESQMKNIVMRNFLAASSFCLAVLGFASSAAALPNNVVLGKTVTVTGSVGVISPAGLLAGWGDGVLFPPASLSSVVDGVYLSEGTYWQTDTVWWDEQNAGSLNAILEIDLEGLFLIDFLSIQADNNDEYLISYRDQFGVWINYGYFQAFGGPGVRERAGSIGSFVAEAIRIDARAGDGYYAVSEFQASGRQVPEPGSILLLGAALAGLGFSRVRKA